MNRLNRVFETIPMHLIKHKYIYWLIFIGMVVLIGISLPDAKMLSSRAEWFEEGDPLKEAEEKLIEAFGKTGDSVVLAIKAKNGDVFSYDTLRAIRGLRWKILDSRDQAFNDRSNYLSHVKKVTTLTSLQILEAKEDCLVLKNLYPNPLPGDSATLNRIKETALQQEKFFGNWFSNDLQYTKMVISTDFGQVLKQKHRKVTAQNGATDPSPEELYQSKDDELIGFDEENGLLEYDESIQSEKVKYQRVTGTDNTRLMKALGKLLNDPAYSEYLSIYPAGSIALADFYRKEVRDEAKIVTYATLGVVIISLWFLFRSLSGVVWPTLIVLVSLACAVGILTWFGVDLNDMFILAVMLTLVVGVADATHIITGYHLFRNSGLVHSQAIRATYRKSGLACLLTSVTTILGMLSLSVFSLKPIRILGMTSALGVVSAFLITIFVLPLMLDLWPPVKTGTQKHSRFKNLILVGFINLLLKPFMPIARLFRVVDNTAIQAFLDTVFHIVRRRPYTICFSFGIVFVLCVYGTTQVRISTNNLDDYDEQSRIKQTIRILEEKLGGNESISIYIDMKQPNALKNSKVIHFIEELQRNLERHYPDTILETNSIVDMVKASYKGLNGNREEMYTVPSDQVTLSQVIEMGSIGGIGAPLSYEFDKTLIHIAVKKRGTGEYADLIRGVNQSIEDAIIPVKKAYPNASVTLTGSLVNQAILTEIISLNQLKSIGLAITIISLVLFCIFGISSLSPLSIIPNIIPAVFSAGVLGLLGYPIDTAVLLVGPIIIGISVDDTIHFMTYYQGEIITTENVELAIRATLREVGQAVIYTSLILGFGFMTFGFSPEGRMAKFGILGGFAVFVALLCDLFLLPALLLIFKPGLKNKAQTRLTATTN